MFKYITLSLSNEYNSKNYPSSGLYVVDVSDGERRDIILVLKELQGVTFLGNDTPSNRKYIEKVFEEIVFSNNQGSLEVRESQDPADAVLKAIAVMQKPELIKDIV